MVHALALMPPFTKCRTCLFFSEIMAPTTLAATRRRNISFESTGLQLLLLLYTFTECTAVLLTDIVFICDVIISTDLVCSLDRQPSFTQHTPPHLVIAYAENVSALRMSFGVIVSKSQVSASLSRAVLYCSYSSPASCTRLLNV